MSLFSKEMHYKNIDFSAMAKNNITRTAKQLTATLLKVFAELLSSESCRNDPLFYKQVSLSWVTVALFALLA